jgi:hypothetical protein
LAEPADARAPTNVIPDIALEPDIKGVCSVDGTLLISSKPRKTDNTKTKVRKIISTLASSAA